MKNTDKNIIDNKRKTIRKIKSKKTPKKSKNKTQKKTIKNTKRKPTCRNCKRKLMKGGEEEDVCAICLDELKQEDIITLSCGHRFHKVCITDACNKSRNTSNCFCPYCRKELTQEDKEQIGFTSTNTPTQTLFPSDSFPPYLSEIEDFGQYINNKLRAPTRLPLEALTNNLDAFLGTDRLPVDIYDKIMEFDLQQIGTLYRYRFIGIVQNIPRQRGNKKYFVYTEWDDEDADEDDYTLIAAYIEEI
jgi:hypothetical protein